MNTQQSAMQAILDTARTDEERECIRITVHRIAESGYRHIRVTRRPVAEAPDVHSIRIADHKTSDVQEVQELGIELQFLIRTNPGGNFLVSFTNVYAIPTAVLGKLIIAHQLVKSLAGKLILTSVNPQLQQVFRTTKLDQLFDIVEDEAAAMAAF
jgi:anti-anti-sigma regulatory factor